MRGLKVILLVVMAAAGLTLGTGVGTSAGQGTTPSKQASLHVRELILKGGGVHTYVRMPERVKRILRAQDIPAFSCPGASIKVNNSTAQTCVWPDTFTGTVTCLQVSISANVTQTCDSTQTNTTANNNALVAQVIWSKNPAADQDGTQIVRLRQTNAGGANNAGVGQFIKQSKGPGTPDDTEETDVEPLAAATLTAGQNQEGHQTIHLRQVNVTGDDNAALLQFLRQRERSSNAATANQNQNVQSRPTSCVPEATSDGLAGVSVDPNANQCILSNQTATSGRLNLLMNGDYNQLQRARKATSGSQTQGVPFQGGSDYGLTQNSTGLAKILTNQGERQVQRAIDSNVFQSQNGPRKGSGSTQGTNPADTWVGTQSSTQIQTNTTTGFAAVASAGNQTNIFQYFGNTSGDIRATQTANQNGDVTTNSCPPPNAPPTTQNQVCAATIVCTSPGVGFLSVQQTSNCQATTVCPEGTVFNPATGQCDPIPTCTIECIGSPAPAPPLYSRRR